MKKVILAVTMAAGIIGIAAVIVQGYHKRKKYTVKEKTYEE